ncbi:ABC transporter permease [Paenarthrobacter aurescens]|uniref:ABC transporter permease n=1 Tax=Paenarthrobacter aurescens TaxID=43663 RepID=A0A4Y3NQ04_PAEAU|nr:ABC transporter permease [Paenarthrobacter aurescens]MDO6144234.1 ABC transporter permease [Paenarthrobacter aurescens]MDO6148081.1 ABC transporter permease [Paenarthrobacter aurescens]MDO6159325.1 ABC transporter permease [Paenarthrobacter aurescens]MDO6163308.1 ABC transporter permease [Paenarthrobacter aurescens]GEB20829.1 ABC transporter permease [Paenarthrobacter aurescens]
MNIFAETIAWLTNPKNWTGTGGIPTRLLEHLQYSALVLLIAAAIAVPIGLYIGHTGRGRVVAVAVAGALRALPTLGLLVLFALLAGSGLMPPVWALVILTVPPLLAGTYAGISSVDATVVDAARAMGMTELQILFRVEVPNGLQVMFGGIRTAVLQVIATVSVVAYLPLGGLGRYLFDGLVLQDFPRMLGGSLLIAGLAIAVDLILAGVQRLVLSPGLTLDSRGRQKAADDLTASVPAGAAVQGGTP